MTEKGKSVPQTQSLKVLYQRLFSPLLTHNTGKYCHTLGNTVLTVPQTNPLSTLIPHLSPAFSSTVHREPYYFHPVRVSLSINFEFGYRRPCPFSLQYPQGLTYLQAHSKTLISIWNQWLFDKHVGWISVSEQIEKHQLQVHSVSTVISFIPSLHDYIHL